MGHVHDKQHFSIFLLKKEIITPKCIASALAEQIVSKAEENDIKNVELKQEVCELEDDKNDEEVKFSKNCFRDYDDIKSRMSKKF